MKYIFILILVFLFNTSNTYSQSEAPVEVIQDIRIPTESTPTPTELPDGVTLEGIEEELRNNSEDIDISQEDEGSQKEDVNDQVDEEPEDQEEEYDESSEKKNLDNVSDVDGRIYGQHVFKNNELSFFKKSSDLNPSDSYIMGQGDEVSVTIWGESSYSGNFIINKDGYVKPNQFMPRIYLSGLTYEQAKEALKKSFKEYFRFRDDQFAAVLSHSRNLTVNIVGEVVQSGGYNIPAINTAFNALTASGGPTTKGSIRNIRIMRSGVSDIKMDVYKYLNDPSYKEEFYLENYDYIFVPISEKVINIKGGVNRPHNYELIQGEYLHDLIEYAGGFTSNVSKHNIQIIRYDSTNEIIIDIPFEEINNNIPLQDGDRVRVGKITSNYSNFVTVKGAVLYPDNYEYKSNMKLLDVLNTAKLSQDARKDLVYINRYVNQKNMNLITINLEKALKNPSSDQNVLLQVGDQIIVFSNQEFEKREDVTISGSVRNPGSFNYSEGMRLSDVINLSRGLVDASEIAYISRTNEDLTKTSIKINPVLAIQSPDSEENLVLFPNDKILIYKKDRFIDQSNISIRGAVRAPGIFPYKENITLKDIIIQAGGFTKNAAHFQIDLSRIVIDTTTKETIITSEIFEINPNLADNNEVNILLLPDDKIFVRVAPNFEPLRTITIEGEVLYPGEYTLTSKNETILDIIERAGGLTEYAFVEGANFYRSENNYGIVILDLEEALNDPSSHFNYILSQGDKIIIPRSMDLVTIRGQINYLKDNLSVSNDIHVPYHNSENAKFYVKKYGAGKTKKGKYNNLKVVQPNGEIQQTKNFLFFKKHPEVNAGSTITVQKKKEKPEREVKKVKEKIDWGKALKDSLAAATATLTFLLLIQRVD